MKCFAGLSKGTGIVSRTISWGQKGRYSHAFIAVYLESIGRWYVIDSTLKGVKIHLMEEFAKHNRIVKKFNIESTEDQRKKVLEKAISLSYTKYPVVEIFGNALQLIVKWLSFGAFKIKNPFGLGERFPRCQEYVAITLRDVFGYRVKENLDSTDLVWLDEFLTSVVENGNNPVI